MTCLPKLLGQCRQNFQQIMFFVRTSYFVSFERFGCIDDVMAAILSKKRGHCHGLSFASIFLKLCTQEAVLITRFGIEFQHSRLSTLTQNGGSKMSFFSKWPPKLKVTKNKNKISRHTHFDLLITKISIICRFGAKLPVK